MTASHCNGWYCRWVIFFTGQCHCFENLQSVRNYQKKLKWMIIFSCLVFSYVQSKLRMLQLSVCLIDILKAMLKWMNSVLFDLYRDALFWLDLRHVYTKITWFKSQRLENFFNNLNLMTYIHRLMKVLFKCLPLFMSNLKLYIYILLIT